MSHWIHSKGDDLLSEIEDAVDDTGWSCTVSSTDKGPIELEHDDGSIASLVQSGMTKTLAVEYEPGARVSEGVALNKGRYHHESFAFEAGEDAVEWLVNVVEQHEDAN